MVPAAGALVFFVRVLGIMQEAIVATAELNAFVTAQSAAVLKTPFFVGQKDERLAVLNEFKTKSAIRMTQGQCLALKTTQRTTAIFPFIMHAAEMKIRIQSTEVKRIM